jgi:hypothetical protein
MEIKCIETRDYKLTLNLIYNTLEERDNRYIIRNDSGSKVAYSKDLFKTVEEEIIVPVALTLEEELDLITFEGNQLAIKEEECILNIEESIISCGIYELNGILSLSECVENSFLKFKKQIIHYILRKAVINYGGSMLLISTNTNVELYTEELKEVLEKISETSYTNINPNSRNPIVLYVIDTIKLRDSIIEEL